MDQKRGMFRPKSSRGRSWLAPNRESAKFVAALVFALVAIAAVVWRVAPWRVTGVQAVNHEHEALDRPTANGVAVHPIPEEDFRQLSTAQDVEDSMSELERRIALQAGSVDGLSLLPIADQEAFAHAVAQKFTPYLTGDFNAYVGQFEMFGGSPVDPSSMKGPQLAWEALSPMYRFASIALDRAQVRGFPDGKMKGTMAQDFKYMRELGIETPNISASLNGGAYPAVAEWKNKGLDAYEVRMPIRLTPVVREEALRLAVIGVAFAQNPATGQWQPVETRLYHGTSKEPMPTSPTAEGFARLKYTPYNIPL